MNDFLQVDAQGKNGLHKKRIQKASQFSFHRRRIHPFMHPENVLKDVDRYEARYIKP